MPEAPSPLLPPPAVASSPASSVLRARRRRRGWRRPRGLLGWGALVAFFVMNWWMFSRLQDPAARPHFRLRRHHPPRAVAAANSSLSTLEEVGGVGKRKRPHQVMLTRLLALAAHALAEAET